MAARREAALARAAALEARVSAELAYLGPGLDERRRQWLRASVYGLYRLLAEYRELLAPGDSEGQLAALRVSADILDSVARGSDAHAFAAVRLLARASAAHGTGSVRTREAELACLRAHGARYGPIDGALARRLVAARRRFLLAASLRDRMGLLAWDAASGADGGEEGAPV